MTPMEVQELLLEASAFDGRPVTEETVTAWHHILKGFQADQAMAAMRKHYSTEDRRLMPVHVVSGVKKLRSELMGGFQGPGLSREIPDADPDNVMDYLAKGIEQRSRAGDGVKTEALQLVGRIGRMPSGFRDPTPKVVGCPECRALVGRNCRSAKGEVRVPHVSRVKDFDQWKRDQGREVG